MVEPLVIVAPGELDVATAPGFRDDVALLFATGARHVVIDLRGTRFCDSSGIGALLGVAALAKELGATFVLQGPPPALRSTLRVSGADSMLEIEP